ncbi:MAG: AAA family ATPase [Anaerobutyricum soehngenii]
MQNKSPSGACDYDRYYSCFQRIYIPRHEHNLTVITTTSERYSDCFGFTEKEVFQSLEIFKMGDQKENVKTWYDGFTFGKHKDIYNPWSITNFLKEGQLRPYWASTSSNGLVNKMLQSASPEIKTGMETLLDGGTITVNFDEQIVFEQLEKDENAIWSLLLASGYLKVKKVEYRGDYIRSMVSSFYYQSGNNWDVFQYV